MKPKLDVMLFRVMRHNKILGVDEPMILLTITHLPEGFKVTGEQYFFKVFIDPTLSWKDILRYVRYCRSKFLDDLEKERAQKKVNPFNRKLQDL